MGYNFNLEPNEAELLMNALQRQTNNLLNKIQTQFQEQTSQEKVENDEDELLTEEENGVERD